MMKQAVVFEGSEQVNVFRAIAIKHALLLYARTGMKANRMYTPKNMIAAASQITGQKFKPRDYVGAANGIEEWLATQYGPGGTGNN